MSDLSEFARRSSTVLFLIGFGILTASFGMLLGYAVARDGTDIDAATNWSYGVGLLFLVLSGAVFVAGMILRRRVDTRQVIKIVQYPGSHQ